MSNFIPRSIGTGRGGEPRSGWQNRDDHRGRARGTRGYGGSRARGRSNHAFRPVLDNKSGTGRSRPPNQRNFHNRGRGFSRGRGAHKVATSDKGPVSIIFPDDPRHPDFETDPRNAGLRNRQEKRTNRDEVRSDDEDSAVESDHETMDKEDLGNMSDEGLRITVENKASSMSVADPSFYDEIQPRQSSSSTEQPAEKEMKAADMQHSTHSKKQSKKAGKESIRITVGNDRFTDDSKDKSSASPPRDEPPDVQSVDKKDHNDRNRIQEKSNSRDRSLAKDKQRSSKQTARSRSRDRYRRSRSRSRDRLRSRSRSRGRSHRSRSRERYQNRKRDRYRSRSRSLDRFRNDDRSRGRNQGRYRSRSRERHRSRSPQRHRGPIRSQSPGIYRGRSRSRSHGSLDGRSNSYSISHGRNNSRSPDRGDSPRQHRAWSRESLSSISDGSLNASSKAPIATTKIKPNSQNINNEGKRQTSNQAAKPKDNPFMDFLNELDYPKLSEDPTSKKAPKVEEASRTPPWLKDSSKGSDISEIEKYLESKLKEVRTSQELKEKTQAQAQNYLDHPGQMRQSYSDMAPSVVPGKSSSWHEQNNQVDNVDRMNYQIAKASKESTPFDMYDDLPRAEPIRQKMASPPPLETKPVKSILKKKTIEPQTSTEPLPYAMSGRPRDQTPHSDTCSITDRPEMTFGESQPQDTAVLGMTSLMNIDDEDEFLYGGGAEPTSQPATSLMKPSNTTKPEVVSSNLDESIYRGGYSGNSADPGWEVAEPSDRFAGEHVDKSPVKAEEPKNESDKLSADPTIQNILKSIGFNFELSKLMQEKAEKNRKTDEDMESYGIKQGSSFLGGGMSGADMQSALATESGSASETGEKKGKELRKTSTDKKESYEERARRYREEQLKENSAHLKDSYGEPGYNQQDPYSSQHYMETQPHQSSTYYDSHHPEQDYSSYENQTSNYPYSSSDMSAVTQSNLTTIQTSVSDFDHDTQGSRGQPLQASALHSLQSQYEESDRYRDQDERQRYRQPSPGIREQRPFNERGDYDARVQPPQARNTQYDRASSYDRQSAPRKHDASQEKPLFPIIREKSSTGSSTSRRTVLPPKRESRESSAAEVKTIKSRDSQEVRKVQSRESPVKEVRNSREPVKEVRKIQSKPIEKPVKPEPEHKPIKKVSKMTNKEREELVQEINERAKRLKLLEKELSRLRKQENELMRKKQRQKDGHKDQLLEQNTQLQREIGQQIKVLRRAAEVNAKLLAASRRDSEAEVDFLALVKDSTGDAESSEKKTQQTSRSRSPSPTRSSKKPPKVRGKSPEPEKGYKTKMKFEYFDPGNHWCKQCNHVSTNVYEFFGHLQSKRHQQKLDPYDRPWMPESLKNPSKGSTGQTVAAAFKGVEFMMSTQSFYCSLCKVFSGDMTCAEDHMKSSEHNDKYQGYLEENPYYERRYNLDKAAGLSMGSVSKDHASDEEKERDVDKTAMKLKQERKESRHKEQEPAEDIKYRSERSKRYVDYDESERNLVRKKAKIAEEKKRESGQRRQDVISKGQERSRSEDVQDDSEPIIRRTISAVPKAPEQKTVPFAKFSWKSGPLIGKAPGYKKAAAASSSDPNGEKISIKLGGRMPRTARTAPPQPVKVVVPVQDVEDPAKDPEYQLRKKQWKKEDQVFGPAPLDIFLTVGKKSSADQGTSIPTVGNNPEPTNKQTLSPTVIADAFSGKNDEDESMDTVEVPNIPIPVPTNTREEEREMKMLGIEHSDTVTVAVKPTQLVLQPSTKPSSSMAASSTDTIYNVFFGSKDGENESGDKGEMKESKE